LKCVSPEIIIKSKRVYKTSSKGSGVNRWVKLENGRGYPRELGVPRLLLRLSIRERHHVAYPKKVPMIE